MAPLPWREGGMYHGRGAGRGLRAIACMCGACLCLYVRVYTCERVGRDEGGPVNNGAACL